MTGTGELRDGVRGDAAVRSSHRAGDRPCARPDCVGPARATLTFRYGTREAWVERLAEHTDPQAYDLCATHAARTRPPEGWELRDRRPEDERRPDVPHATPVDLGSDRTVAVLAAALRSVPDPVSEDAVADSAEVGRSVVAPAVPAAPEAMLEEPSPVLELDLVDPVPDSGTKLADPTPTAAPIAGSGQPRPPLAVRQRETEASAGGAAADW